jgi:hypothetical protein
MITKITELNSVESTDNSCPKFNILDFGQPAVEGIGRFNFVVYDSTVALKRQAVNIFSKNRLLFVRLPAVLAVFSCKLPKAFMIYS